MLETHGRSRRSLWWLVTLLGTLAVLWLALKDWHTLYAKTHVMTALPMPQHAWGDPKPWVPFVSSKDEDTMQATTPPWVLSLRSPIAPSEQLALFERLKAEHVPVWMRSLGGEDLGDLALFVGPWLDEAEADQWRIRLVKNHQMTFEVMRYDAPFPNHAAASPSEEQTP